VPNVAGAIAGGDNFEHIRDPENHGHPIYWGKEWNEEVDFGCDRLRAIAQEQAALIAHAS
jgi:hypothetical protein